MMYYLVNFYDENDKIIDVTCCHTFDSALTYANDNIVKWGFNHLKIFYTDGNNFRDLVFEYLMKEVVNNADCK